MPEPESGSEKTSVMADLTQTRRHRIGAVILGVGALGLSAASGVMLAQNPDVTTHAGRLLIAGALANVTLSLMWAAVALFPLRRGERWAFWVYLLPFPLYGIPMIVLDATYVTRAHLFTTLAPQLGGLLVAVVGLVLVAPGVFRR